VVSTHLKKYARQIGNISPGFGVKIKNISNHHPDRNVLFRGVYFQGLLLFVSGRIFVEHVDDPSPFFGVQVTPKLQQLSSKHHGHDLGRLVGMMSEAHLKNGCM